MKIGLSVYPDELGAIVEDSCYRLPSSMDLGDVPRTPEELPKTMLTNGSMEGVAARMPNL